MVGCCARLQVEYRMRSGFESSHVHEVYTVKSPRFEMLGIQDLRAGHMQLSTCNVTPHEESIRQRECQPSHISARGCKSGLRSQKSLYMLISEIVHRRRSHDRYPNPSRQAPYNTRKSRQPCSSCWPLHQASREVQSSRQRER